MCVPRSTPASPLPSPAGAIRWSSRRSARDGGPFVANDCDLSPPQPERQRRGTNLARHRAEHGRQIDVPAPERAHRRAGADGELRAGTGRPYRRGRPPVLARRRGRRSRPRAFDLHGRDGRDGGDPQPGRRAGARHSRRDRPRHRDLRRALHRLGDDRASAREQSLPRAVRHAFPRDDRARRQAAAAPQRHHAGQGMAGRSRVPARSRARRRRPLLRHPGGEARRAAAERDRARASSCWRSSKPRTASRRRAS